MNEILAEISLPGTGAFAHLFTVLAGERTSPTPLSAGGSRWPVSSTEISTFFDLGRGEMRLRIGMRKTIRRIWLRFIELEAERTQQFTPSKDKTDALRPLFQQQWNFSPSGSTSQIEDYEVDLDGVWMLQLVIDPDIARGSAVASLASWRLS